MWILFACLSALFAGITSILAKCGIRKTDSDVATALRTVVVLIFAWAMVFIVGSQNTITQLSGRTILFLILSGFATGASWLCYFKALQLGNINKVVPIDTSSTVLSVLFAILLLGETEKLQIRLPAVALIALGTYLMIEPKRSAEKEEKHGWMLFAFLSAIFAAATSILGKIGIEGVESNLGTAIRTAVVLVMAWVVVLAEGKAPQLRQLDKTELWFIALSGIATGASWLCYYRALQTGVVSIVVPIDKLSILITILFSRLVFKERLTPKARVGLGLITVATLAMAVL